MRLKKQLIAYILTVSIRSSKMAFFPFMIELNDRQCIVAGGGKVAYKKTLTMLEFGANVTVISPQFCGELIVLANNDSRLELVKKEICLDDIDAAFVVIMATNNSRINHQIADECRKRRILVNVVDVKEECGFYFPAVIKDGDVVISVSTGGDSPLLASYIKKDIKSHIHSNYGEIAKKMGQVREQIKNEIEDENERKKVFSEMIRGLKDELE